MNAAERKALGEYVRWVANDIGLRDWTFKLRWEGCPEEAQASIEPTEGRRVAVIYFCDDFRSLPADDQRNAVVHELIHCHHAAATDIIRVDLVRQLSQSTYELLYGAFRRQVEYMVDALADVVAERMPHIDWPKPARRRRATTKSTPRHR